MEIDVVRKDAPPAETIERIHAVLDSLGFRREHAVVQRWTAVGHCHSCHLRFRNYPLLYANGKGVTDELAYASALAEFMERLQCWVDGFFTRAGNIHRLAPFFAATHRTSSQLALEVPELVAGDLAALRTVPAESTPCFPFVDVFGERVVDLPFELLCATTGSNGMCAGNTPEEAISHGICEVFERHVIRLLESRRVDGLPTLPFDSLPVRSAVLARQRHPEELPRGVRRPRGRRRGHGRTGRDLSPARPVLPERLRLSLVPLPEVLPPGRMVPSRRTPA